MGRLLGGQKRQIFSPAQLLVCNHVWLYTLALVQVPKQVSFVCLQDPHFYQPDLPPYRLPTNDDVVLHGLVGSVRALRGDADSGER